MRNILMSVILIVMLTAVAVAYQETLINEKFQTGLTVENLNPVRPATDDPDFECDPDSFWSQPFDGQEVYTVSDAGQENQVVSADDFEGLTLPITAIEWWGGELQCCWSGCTKGNLDFVITFYEYGALPGAVVYQETITADRIVTSAFVFGNSVLGEVKKYSAEFTSPVSLASGWVSVQAVNSGTCWFLWADAGFTAGTQEYMQNSGSGWQPGGYNADLAFCLISGEYPPHVTLVPEVSSRFAPANSVVTHTLTLRNRAGVTEEFDLSIVGNTWVTDITSSNPVLIPDGGNATVTVAVAVPPGAIPPDSDSCLLTAVGDTTGLEASAVLNTEVGDYPHIIIEPDAFDVVVGINGTLTETMTIRNEGTIDLDWLITMSDSGSRDIGNWENVSPVATPVQWSGSAHGDGKFFVVGGLSSTAPETLFNGMQIFDTATGSWTTSSVMNTPVFACVAEYYQGYVYVAGGYINGSFVATNSLQVYNVATDTWSAGPTMPTARGGNSGGLIDGVMYSLGGAPDGNFPAANVAYAFDFAANAWSALNNGPINTYGILLGGAGVLNGKIYYGGHFSTAYYQFYEFDPAGGGIWTTKATFPTELGGQSVSLVGIQNESLVLGVGGGNSWTATGTTFAYYPHSDTWINLNKPMTTAVLGGACAAFDGNVYFYGGTIGSGPVTPAPFMKTSYTDIPWLSVQQMTGSTTPGNFSDVNLYFDASATNGTGVYEAWLVVNSNDPLINPWFVPVIMTVSDGPTPTPEPQCLNHGDVNFDGNITAGDAQIAFNIALGIHVPSFEEHCAADCSGDGNVTAGDAQLIFFSALGLANCVDPL